MKKMKDGSKSNFQEIHCDIKLSKKCSSSRLQISSTRTFYSVLFCALLFIFNFPAVLGTITVISQITNESIIEIEDEPARFVPDRVSFYGIQVRVLAPCFGLYFIFRKRKTKSSV